MIKRWTEAGRVRITLPPHVHNVRARKTRERDLRDQRSFATGEFATRAPDLILYFPSHVRSPVHVIAAT
jgi:hypothetical protein